MIWIGLQVVCMHMCFVAHMPECDCTPTVMCHEWSPNCMWSSLGNWDDNHSTAVWDCCFPYLEAAFSANTRNHWIRGGVYPADYKTHAQRAERVAEIMLGILPPALGGDVRDWEKQDESETMVHNMVSTSVVHGSEMPINLSQLAMLLPCSTYDRKRFAAITIRIDNPRCTALLFTSGKLVITGVKSW